MPQADGAPDWLDERELLPPDWDEDDGELAAVPGDEGEVAEDGIDDESAAGEVAGPPADGLPVDAQPQPRASTAAAATALPIMVTFTVNTSRERGVSTNGLYVFYFYDALTTH